jgi:hypothetical protein
MYSSRTERCVSAFFFFFVSRRLALRVHRVVFQWFFTALLDHPPGRNRVIVDHRFP